MTIIFEVFNSLVNVGIAAFRVERLDITSLLQIFESRVDKLLEFFGGAAGIYFVRRNQRFQCAVLLAKNGGQFLGDFSRAANFEFIGVQELEVRVERVQITPPFVFHSERAVRQGA